MAEGEELESLLMVVKEGSEKADLKLNIQKTKIMASGPMPSWQIDGETVETMTDFHNHIQNSYFILKTQWSTLSFFHLQD